MAGKTFFGKKFYYFFALILLSVIGLLFQNCGEVRVQPRTDQTDLGSVESETAKPSMIKTPAPPDFLMRAVFVIDMSRSMTTTACPDSVDYIPAAGGDCSDGGLGSDSAMYRLEAIDNWLDEVEKYMQMQNLPAENFKAIVVPFSGQNAQSDFGENFAIYQGANLPNLPLSLAVKSFKDIEKVRNAIEGLRTLQYSWAEAAKVARIPDMKLPKAGHVDVLRGFAELKLRTSLPGPQIDNAKEAIAAEIAALKAQDKLNKARFEIVFLSDGVPKPAAKHVFAALQILWDTKQVEQYRPAGPCYWNGYIYPCALQVQNVDYSAKGLNCAVTCKAPIDYYLSNGRVPTDGLTTTCKRCLDAAFQYNFQVSNQSYEMNRDLFQDMKNTWGDFLSNTPDVIVGKVKELERLFKYNSAAQYRFSFFRVESKVPRFAARGDEITSAGNWLLRAKEVFQGTARHEKLTSGRARFSLFPGIGSGDSYKLGTLYAINTHARVNSAYVMDIDSDGDGIFDFEESQLSHLNLDPQKARSNGICLDSITFKLNGCFKDACDENKDIDRDGLNECEEKTVGTSDQNFDTDGEGIPDLLEVIYGHNPLINDYNQDTNSDSITNLNNFMRGLDPWHYFNQVASDLLSRVSINFSGYTSTKNLIGQTIKVPSYTIQVLNIKTTSTLAATQSLNLNNPFVDYDHAEKINRIQFYGRVDSVQNPGDSYWIHFYQDVPFQAGSQKIILDLQKFNILNVKDPHEASP